VNTGTAGGEDKTGGWRPRRRGGAFQRMVGKWCAGGGMAFQRVGWGRRAAVGGGGDDGRNGRWGLCVWHQKNGDAACAASPFGICLRRGSACWGVAGV